MLLLFFIFFMQTLVTNDKILSIKSEVTGISVQNSTWLHNLVSIKKTNESEVFQGKCSLTI